MSFPPKIKPESVVNAYLFYAQRLLNLMSSATLTEYKADQMAVTASVCLSLKQSWQAWLEELSAYVGSSIPDYASIFLPENSTHPEIIYLLKIGKEQNNWLSQLHGFFEPRLNVMVSVSDSDDQDLISDSLTKKISLVSVDNDVKLSEEERLVAVLNNFKAYVKAVRLRQSEW